MNDKHELLSQLRIDRSQAPAATIKWHWLLLGLVLVVLLVVASWLIFSPKAVPVQLNLARASALEQGGATVLNATGYVTARRYATVSSKVTGKVVEVLVEEGMFVEEGQIVARLDDVNQRKQLALNQAEVELARAQLAEAQARLTEAELTLERAREMWRRQLISHAELNAAESHYGSAKAQADARKAGILAAERHLALQQQNLDDLTLRAPFAGVVVAKNAQPGEMISPISAGGGFTRTGICSLVDMDSLEIEVEVNEAYIQRVRAGQPVEATLDAYPEWRIPASVIAVIPTADRQKATVKVRVGFLEQDQRILPDMGVRVAFMSSGESENQAPAVGVRVPATAVRTEGSDQVIFVVSDDIAQRRRVTLGTHSGRERVVLSGLTPGEYYVRDIPPGLRDGVSIKVQ